MARGAHVPPICHRIGSRTLRDKHIVSDNDCTWGQLRIDEIEHWHIQMLPKIDQYEIEGPGQILERRESIPDAKFHLLGEPRPANLSARVLRLCRLELQRYKVTLGGSRRIGKPKRRIAVGGPNLQEFSALALLNEDVEE